MTDIVALDADTTTERLSLELLDELAANERRIIDPRSVPARFSSLKHFAKSPAHGRYAMVTETDDDSLARRLGSGAHAKTFGTPEVVVYPGKVRRGKDWDAFAAAHNGDCILNEREYRQATAISEAIKRNETAHRLLFTKGTIHESRIDWEWMGRKCRSTPDARQFRTLVELKSCRTAQPGWFTRDAERMAYHAQLAFYRRAIETATKVAPQEIYIVAVEQKPPYAVTVFRLTERALEQGEKLVRIWFEQMLACEAAEQWPEYSQTIVDFDLMDREEAFRIEVDGEDVEL